jgi:hypothetical protein
MLLSLLILGAIQSAHILPQFTVKPKPQITIAEISAIVGYDLHITDKN